ncbi:MAG: cation:proton antiporter [Candidatus Methylomirabilales bacterium]
MGQHLLIGLASIVVLGIGAQWLAWRLRLPSILLLLIFGFAAGPGTGFLDPDKLFGDLLLPLVSVSVAVILFEGGLSLRIATLREIGVVRNLITIGVCVTWLISAGAGHLFLGLDMGQAVLLGAILVVTGPTVIVPLLRLVRPKGQLASIVKWEGILVDPIGALLAVLVFEAVLAGRFEGATAQAALGVFKAGFIGGALGMLGAGVMILLLKRYWIPDFLQNPVSLMTVVTVFTMSNVLQTESGLLTVTVMGIVLGNQKTVPVKHIIEFKENLRVLLISVLFIILAARLQIDDLRHISVSSLAFLAVLIFIARPAAVALSALRSDLSWQERMFLSWMAPRGIIAAAVSSIFALKLVEAGRPQAGQLVPITFLVIIGTVTIYGLTASRMARWLGVATPNPQGALIIGAHSWARAVASVLQEEGYEVLLVDTDRRNISAARLAGLPTFYASILSDSVLDEIDLGTMGRLLALTSDDAVNALGALHFVPLFGRSEVYQLAPEAEGKEGDETFPPHLRGRLLFGAETTYTFLVSRFEAGAEIKKTAITEQFDYEAFRALYGERALPLFVVSETGDLIVWTADNPPTPKPGQSLISLVSPS